MKNQGKEKSIFMKIDTETKDLRREKSTNSDINIWEFWKRREENSFWGFTHWITREKISEIVYRKGLPAANTYKWLLLSLDMQSKQCHAWNTRFTFLPCYCLFSQFQRVGLANLYERKMEWSTVPCSIYWLDNSLVIYVIQYLQ